MKSENWFRKQARKQYRCEAQLEIDDNASASIGDNGGLTGRLGFEFIRTQRRRQRKSINAHPF